MFADGNRDWPLDVKVEMIEMEPTEGFRNYMPTGRYFCTDESGVVSVLTQSEAAEWYTARS